MKNTPYSTNTCNVQRICNTRIDTKISQQKDYALKAKIQRLRLIVWMPLVRRQNNNSNNNVRCQRYLSNPFLICTPEKRVDWKRRPTRREYTGRQKKTTKWK
mmetsp:Transcript_3760/g.7684  ORF Transcript_3760/g.7684 Transcript_3760/m.7684 type:complete len:102 (-) Transcript_3760:47-352(-)